MPTRDPAKFICDDQGNVFVRADLYRMKVTSRWTPKRKLIVVRALRAGMITIKEASEWYNLSQEEVVVWERGYRLNDMRETHAVERVAEQRSRIVDTEDAKLHGEARSRARQVVRRRLGR